MDLAQIFPSLVDELRGQFDPALLTGVGLWLLAATTSIAIFWGVIKHLLQGESFNGYVSLLITTAFSAGLVRFALTSPGLVEEVRGGFELIARTIAPEAELGPALGRMLHAALNVWGFDSAETAPAPEISTWDKFAGAFSGQGLMNGLLSVPVAMSGAIYKILTSLLILASALIYAGNYILSQIMFDLAWMLAPIFLPWLLLNSFSWLATGWFQFMVSAGVLKIVGAAMLAATSGFIKKAADMSAAAVGDPLVNFQIYAGVFLLAGLMAYLMLQVQSIASGLTRGFNSTEFSIGSAGQSSMRAINSSGERIGSTIANQLKSLLNRK